MKKESSVSDLQINFRDDEARKSLDRRCVRKLDLSVLPITALFYLLSFLDRSNIGNARVAGLQKDLGLSSHQYLTVITCTYVLYIAFELPSNLLLKKVGAQRLLPFMVTAWGIVTTLTGLVQSYAGLIVIRLILGALEGGLFPGLVLYLSFFYKRNELQTRIALFFSAASLSGAFSGLLAAAIVNMDGLGNQEGWRWIFYIEGIFTVLCGVVCYFLLPDHPSTSLFLTAEEKEHILARLMDDIPKGAKSEMEDVFAWKEVWASLSSLQVIFLAIALFGNGVTLYSFAYFTPTIVSTLGYGTIHTQLLTVPPFVVAFFFTMLSAWYSDRYGRRFVCVVVASLLGFVGLTMFYANHTKSVRYGSLFLSIPGVYGTAPALTTWMPNNSAPHFRKATAIALGFVCTNSGGILSTWMFPSSQAPNYKNATILAMAMSLMTCVFALINFFYLKQMNAKKLVERENIAQNMTEEESVREWEKRGDKHWNFIYNY